MCVCVCVCVSEYIYVYTYTHTHTHTHIPPPHTHAHARTHTHTHTHTHVHIYVCIHAFIVHVYILYRTFRKGEAVTDADASHLDSVDLDHVAGAAGGEDDRVPHMHADTALDNGLVTGSIGLVPDSVAGDFAVGILYICIYILINTHTHTNTHTRIHTYIYIHVYTCIYIYIGPRTCSGGFTPVAVRVACSPR
jgi:hypothetical protein